MNRLWSGVTSALMAMSISIPSGAAPSAVITPAKIDAVFKDFGPTTPGCAVGIYSAGEVLYAKGYGMANLDLNVPITPETLFDIGSTSKQFTAAAAVLLANEGKLSLSDDVRKYVPEVPDYGRVITIDHLLHHTSGLRDYDGLLNLAGHYEEDVTTDDDALDIIAAQKALNFETGTRWSYSNTGFFLISVIVKRVSGQTLADVAKARIFTPLGMEKTHFRNDHAAILKDRAVAYAPNPQGGFKIEMSNWDQLGDGAVNTNVLELAKWDGEFYDPKVGGAALINTLQLRGTLDDGKPTNYGRGLFLDTYRGLNRVQHGGAWAGYRAMLMRFPDQRLAIGLTCNVSNANTRGRAEAVADAVLEGAFQAGKAGTPTLKPFVGPKLKAAALAGVYVSDGAQSVIHLTPSDAGLALRLSGQSEPLVQTGERQFEPPGFPIAVTFDADHQGLVLTVLGEAEPHYRRVPAFTPKAVEIESLAGRYHSPELGADFAIRVKEGVAYLKARAIEEARLEPIDHNTLATEDAFLVLKRDAAGHVTGFDMSASRMLRIHFERSPPQGKGDHDPKGKPTN